MSFNIIFSVFWGVRIADDEFDTYRDYYGSGNLITAGSDRDGDRNSGYYLGIEVSALAYPQERVTGFNDVELEIGKAGAESLLKELGINERPKLYLIQHFG